MSATAANNGLALIKPFGKSADDFVILRKLGDFANPER